MRLPALATTLLLAAASSAQAEIVFGNLGSTGAGNLSATNTDIGTDYASIAVGFYTPLTTYYLQSVTLGVFYDNASTAPISIGLYSVFDTLVATSAPTLVGTGGKYTFTFNNVALSQDAWYTIQPASGISWYAAAAFAAPTEQNSSGFSYAGASLLSGDNWTAAPFPYSISIAATNVVPEPSTYGMILGGLALAGAALRRRQKAAK